jgi:dipeptidyl aminopeptidase/acylaminoacyl peptidase
MSESPPAEPLSPGRRRAFVALTLACLLIAGAYVAWAAARDDTPGAAARPAGGTTPSAAPDPEGTTVVFQHVGGGANNGRVAVARVDAPGRRTFTGLTCERVYAAAGRGLCLIGEQGLTGPAYKALIFNSAFEVQDELKVQGLLSRARVSPDGRYGATTGFVTGHSYAESDEFSTLTTIIDMQRGKAVGDLEDFAAMRDGRRIRSADRNFWGVTFARDGDTFYATMRTGGSTWLVRGSVGQRRLEALHENVECPSLSPDGTRVAYKKRVEKGSVIWQLYVLDLQTMQETKLADSGLVDDQAEWLDDDTVLYGRFDGSVWRQPADGSGTPRRFLDHALSPAVVAAPA